MSSNISALATRSLAAVEDWMKTTQGNVTGSSRVGFRESDIMYKGGTTIIKDAPTSSTDGLQIGEQTLSTGYTVLNFKQGDIVDSTEDVHMAVQGDGFFLLMNQNTGELFFTRDGEFHISSGQMVNTNGLLVVDRAIAINLGLVTAAQIPAPTVDEVNSNNTGWQPYEMGNNWFPYISGTNYDEAGSYQYQSVDIRKTFFLNGANIPSSANLTVTVDDDAYLFVNGQQVGGIINIGSHPIDIASYLHDGANTIALQAIEYGGGDYIATSGTIAGVDMSTNSTWAASISKAGYTGTTKTNPSNPRPSPPADYNDEFLLKENEKGMVLANTTQLNKLEYSRYGATVFQAPQLSIATDCVIDLPEQKGLGKVLSKKLEASNVDLASNLTKMSLLGKVYNGFVQLIKAYNETVDEALSIIR